jgi:hypothetical protein
MGDAVIISPYMGKRGLHLMEISFSAPISQILLFQNLNLIDIGLFSAGRILLETDLVAISVEKFLWFGSLVHFLAPYWR